MLGHGLGSWADLCDNFSFRVFIDNQEFGFSRVMNLEQDQEVEDCLLYTSDAADE